MTTAGKRGRRRAGACAAVVVTALVALGAGAQSAFALGLQDLAATPADTAAGAHSDFHVHIGFADSTDQVKDLTIHLPPGMVGNPTAAAVCTVAELNGDKCPAKAAVGSVSTATMVWVVKPTLGVPLTVDGTIYNLEPQPGEPARFGIVLRPPASDLGVLPKIKMQSSVQLRHSDYGLDTVLNDIPNQTSGMPVDIQSMDITLRGNVSDGAFMRNPTSCGEARTTFDATSYADPGTTVSGEASFTPTSCDSLPFSPTLSASLGSPGHTAEGSHPPLTVVVGQGDDQAGVRDSTVILPTGIGADNAALATSCPGAQFVAGTCPDPTVVGSAVAASPLLTQPLEGKVVLVAPAVAGPPALGVDLHGQLNLQIFGSFVATSAGPGNSFVGLPDIPLARFSLTFNANHLVLSTRDLCKGGAPVFHADFTGQNGATAAVDQAAEVNGCGGEGGGGGGGNSGPHRKPRASVRVSGTGGGEPKLKLEASGRGTKLRSAKLKLPSGLHFDGSEWRDGASARAGGHRLPDRALHHSGRRLKVKAKGDGSGRLSVKVARGALDVSGDLANKLRFPIVVKDVTGHVTRLTATVKPH